MAAAVTDIETVRHRTPVHCGNRLSVFSRVERQLVVSTIECLAQQRTKSGPAQQELALGTLVQEFLPTETLRVV